MPEPVPNANTLFATLYSTVWGLRGAEIVRLAAELDQYMADHLDVKERVDAWSLCPTEPDDLPLSAQSLIDYFKNTAPPESLLIFGFVLYNVVIHGAGFSLALSQARTLLRLGYFLALRDIESKDK